MFLRTLGTVMVLLFSFVTVSHAEAGKPDAGVVVSAAPSAAPSVAVGVDAGVAPVSAAVSAAASAPVSVAPSAPVVQALASIPGEDFTLQDAVSVYKAAKQTVQGPTLLGICTLISLLTALLVKVIRRFGGRLLSQSHANLAVAILSALAAGAASVVPGMSPWQAAFVGLSPLVLVLGPGPHPSKD